MVWNLYHAYSIQGLYGILDPDVIQVSNNDIEPKTYNLVGYETADSAYFTWLQNILIAE